ncbi:Chaperone required for the assembly of the F1-ATPase [Enhydrobacter aerosaccus]|uniref:Chaperone required for the assembly of the F1-ATPase n=1 Tax=Enhydrobacter aerosaccus TaxID=225324 RepID=A0A1T4JXW0_9HYPH|nr:ATP12 family protein [Enhydrobacter aerosaccus]SJZ34993.1 Chaperone required for the assembly of the F1-ATPase [Enhydrobacter aerosaccus]
MKRFYKETSIAPGDGGWQVLLDGRAMRTPAKAILTVPTQALAEAIAEEWRAVPEKAEIKVAHLPLTRLAATGLDRVTSQRAQVVDDIAKYAASDLLCYRATDPSSLVQRQHEIWQPLLDWVAERYDARLSLASGTSFVTQSPAALLALREAVAAHSDIALSALYNLTHVAGSLVIALAVAERRLSAEDAFSAAELDELFQIERWGEDPLAAQRLANIRNDIDACARFLALLEDKRLGGS